MLILILDLILLLGSDSMKKWDSINLVYQIATLTYPSFEVLQLLEPLEYERTLELLLILRQQPKKVSSPLNFLRRAIEENWTAETTPQKVDRRLENMTANVYERQGYDPAAARKKAREGINNININSNVNTNIN
jgi:hypothetical protein